MRNPLLFVAGVALCGIANFALGDSIQLHQDDVIPVVMQSELNLRDTHDGDVFKADVTDTDLLPRGTKLIGVVNRVVPRHGKARAFMDIEFTSIVLPDGHRVSFHGTPIPLSKNYVTEDRDGRWVAKKGVSKETVVLGATAGGLILGSMIHKPFEGAFVGALVGILAGETDKEDVGDGNVVVPKGSKVGARVEENLTVDFHGDWGDRQDRGDGYDREGYNHDGFDKYGYDRDGHYDAKYDTTRDEPSRTDDNGYDKYGFDKNGHYDPAHDTTRSEPAADRSSDLAIRIRDKEIRYSGDAQPYREGWVVMVPLRQTAEQLGYHVGADDAEGSYRIENDDDVLVVEQDSRAYSLNHRRHDLPAAIKVREGVAYAPIDVFTTLTKGAVYVNGTKYRRGS